jgi:hypothetical protein
LYAVSSFALFALMQQAFWVTVLTCSGLYMRHWVMAIVNCCVLTTLTPNVSPQTHWPPALLLPGLRVELPVRSVNHKLLSVLYTGM